MTGTQLNRSIGVLLIIAAVAGGASVILPQIAVGALGGDQGSLEALDVLENIQDNRALYLLGYALDAIANVALIMLAALLYVLFRGRDRALASVMFALLLTAGGVLMIVSILGFSGQALASSVPSEMPPDSRKLLEAFAGVVRVPQHLRDGVRLHARRARGHRAGHAARAQPDVGRRDRGRLDGAPLARLALDCLGQRGADDLAGGRQRRPARAAHDRRRAHADHGNWRSRAGCCAPAANREWWSSRGRPSRRDPNHNQGSPGTGSGIDPVVTEADDVCGGTRRMCMIGTHRRAGAGWRAYSSSFPTRIAIGSSPRRNEKA